MGSPVPDSAVKHFFEVIRNSFKFDFSKVTTADQLDKEIRRRMTSTKMKHIAKKYPHFKGVWNLHNKNKDGFTVKTDQMLVGIQRNTLTMKRILTTSKKGTSYERTHLQWDRVELEHLKTRSNMKTSVIVKSYYEKFGMSARTKTSIETRIYRIRKAAK